MVQTIFVRLTLAPSQNRLGGHDHVLCQWL